VTNSSVLSRSCRVKKARIYLLGIVQEKITKKQSKSVDISTCSKSYGVSPMWDARR
jgi:hypothetical protein